MKNIFKATLAVAAVAAVGMGSYKAYGSYVATNMSEDDMLLAENVLALAEDVPNGTVDVCVYHRPCYKEEIDDKRTVTNPYTKQTTTQYHHTKKTYYYQVCVNKNYKEAQNYNLCNRSKIVGKAGCTSIGGTTTDFTIYGDGWELN